MKMIKMTIALFLVGSVSTPSIAENTRMLREAIQAKRCPEMGDLRGAFEDGKIDVKDVREHHITLLHDAILGDCSDAAMMLIEYGCDVNQRTQKGQSPLHLAARMGNLVLIRQLLKQGANRCARNDLKQIPRDLAVAYGQIKAADLLPFARTKAMIGVHPHKTLVSQDVPELDWDFVRNGGDRWTWESAKAHCLDKGDGWRLPTIWELRALYLQKSILCDDFDPYFWSSTSLEADPARAWGVIFHVGQVGVNNIASSYSVRCVR